MFVDHCQRPNKSCQHQGHIRLVCYPAKPSLPHKLRSAKSRIKQVAKTTIQGTTALIYVHFMNLCNAEVANLHFGNDEQMCANTLCRLVV